MPTLELPTLEFKIPNDSAPKNDKGEIIKTTEAVTISYSGITGSTTNDKLKNLPRYIKWISGTMTCTIQKSAGAGDLPILMKIGSLTIYTDNNGIPTVLTSLQKPRSHSITIDSTTTNIGNVITLSDDGSFSIQDPSWVFGQNGTTVSKSYTYSNTGLTIKYENPKYIIEGLSNNPEWGEITGTGKVEITKSGDKIIKTITAVPKPGCRFLCWTDGITTPARDVVLKESALSAHKVTKTYSALFAPIALYAGATPISEIYVGTKKAKVYRGSTRIL